MLGPGPRKWSFGSTLGFPLRGNLSLDCRLLVCKSRFPWLANDKRAPKNHFRGPRPFANRVLYLKTQTTRRVAKGEVYLPGAANKRRGQIDLVL